MSWDVSLFKFSRKYSTIEEIPSDEQPLSLGSQAEIHEAISQVFPATDWSDPHWGIFDSPAGSIEFNIGPLDPVESIALHVRATDDIVPGILHLCALQDWQAIDLTDSSFLDQSSDPSAGLHKWQQYLKRVLGRYEV